MHLSHYKYFSNTKSELLSKLETVLSNSGKISHIVTINPEQLVQAKSDSDFDLALQDADIVLADGWGVRLANLLLKIRYKSVVMPHRMPGRLVVKDLIQLADDKNKKILLIGGRNYFDKFNSELGVEAVPASEYKQLAKSRAGDKAHQLYPIWWTPAYTKIESPSAREEDTLWKIINQVKPDIVFVAFGAPNQEKWLQHHRADLNKLGVKIGMVVGGSFDVIFGLVATPPDWVSRLGLEWLFRLFNQPWRIIRQLRLITFGWWVLRDLLKKPK